MKSRLLIGSLLLAATAAAQSDRKFLKSQLLARSTCLSAAGFWLAKRYILLELSQIPTNSRPAFRRKKRRETSWSS